MKATYKLENIGDVEATMTVTMKISEWEALKTQISSSYPGWKFADFIRDIIDCAAKQYAGTTGSDDDR